MKRLTVDIITFAHHNSIQDGRSPTGIVGAALYLSLCFYKTAKFTKPDLSRLCENLSCRVNTTKERIKEIENNLLQYCKDTKYLSHVNSKNLHANIGIIIKDFIVSLNPTDDYNNDSELDAIENLELPNDSNDSNNNNNNKKRELEIYQESNIENIKENNIIKKLKSNQETISTILESEFIPFPKEDIKSSKKEFKERYFQDYQTQFGKRCSFPPSFIENVYKRLIRRLKLIRAKKELIDKNVLVNEQALNMSDTDFYKNYKAYLKTQTDNQDREIIQLLKNGGISDHEIIDRLTDIKELEAKKSWSTHPNLDSEELDDDDIDSNQIIKYLKTPQEVKLLQQLQSQ
ncbi:hypothetical protein DLAC_10717 [Tieghemostelium lacteum]|uniref:Transcription factor TFIIB cyclin-like domain-containing protein n=1 Tax=Tieghemostelium lacteum TaxID=361077 RepID=A0A151Z3Z6_TIELA|nr:hypothetical protein DLAC_10717 [Tieghemostelium lacteum]|eukprot:KYQ88693.1 hypothetical protein DLAC_10717 [Tieghemostelium lacteum]